MTELVAWLAREVSRGLQTKLDELPKKCIPKFSTKVLWIKPVTRNAHANNYEHFSEEKRKINRALDKAMRIDQQNFLTRNINYTRSRITRNFKCRTFDSR